MANLKEDKQREIRRALTERGNMKRKYLRALKEEGMGEREERREERRERPAETAPVLTYAERRQKAKDHRQKAYREKRQREEQVKAEREKKVKKRETDRKKLDRRTSRGQPLMGPRIEKMLEKIRNGQ